MKKILFQNNKVYFFSKNMDFFMKQTYFFMKNYHQAIYFFTLEVRRRFFFQAGTVTVAEQWAKIGFEDYIFQIASVTCRKSNDTTHLCSLAAPVTPLALAVVDPWLAPSTHHPEINVI